jgi:hypothetical protein
MGISASVIWGKNEHSEEKGERKGKDEKLKLKG